MGKTTVEARIYSYAGPRFSGDGVAWAAIRGAEKPTKPIMPPRSPIFNGFSRVALGILSSRQKSGEISKAQLEEMTGMPISRVRHLTNGRKID